MVITIPAAITAIGLGVCGYKLAGCLSAPSKKEKKKNLEIDERETYTSYDGKTKGYIVTEEDGLPSARKKLNRIVKKYKKEHPYMKDNNIVEEIVKECMKHPNRELSVTSLYKTFGEKNETSLSDVDCICFWLPKASCDFKYTGASALSHEKGFIEYTGDKWTNKDYIKEEEKKDKNKDKIINSSHCYYFDDLLMYKCQDGRIIEMWVPSPLSSYLLSNNQNTYTGLKNRKRLESLDSKQQMFFEEIGNEDGQITKMISICCWLEPNKYFSVQDLQKIVDPERKLSGNDNVMDSMRRLSKYPDFNIFFGDTIYITYKGI